VGVGSSVGVGVFSGVGVASGVFSGVGVTLGVFSGVGVASGVFSVEGVASGVLIGVGEALLSLSPQAVNANAKINDSAMVISLFVLMDLFLLQSSYSLLPVKPELLLRVQQALL